VLVTSEETEEGLGTWRSASAAAAAVAHPVVAERERERERRRGEGERMLRTAVAQSGVVVRSGGAHPQGPPPSGGGGLEQKECEEPRGREVGGVGFLPLDEERSRQKHCHRLI